MLISQFSDAVHHLDLIILGLLQLFEQHLFFLFKVPANKLDISWNTVDRIYSLTVVKLGFLMSVGPVSCTIKLSFYLHFFNLMILTLVLSKCMTLDVWKYQLILQRSCSCRFLGFSVTSDDLNLMLLDSVYVLPFPMQENVSVVFFLFFHLLFPIGHSCHSSRFLNVHALHELFFLPHVFDMFFSLLFFLSQFYNACFELNLFILNLLPFGNSLHHPGLSFVTHYRETRLQQFIP